MADFRLVDDQFFVTISGFGEGFIAKSDNDISIQKANKGFTMKFKNSRNNQWYIGGTIVDDNFNIENPDIQTVKYEVPFSRGQETGSITIQRKSQGGGKRRKSRKQRRRSLKKKTRHVRR